MKTLADHTLSYFKSLSVVFFIRIMPKSPKSVSFPRTEFLQSGSSLLKIHDLNTQKCNYKLDFLVLHCEKNDKKHNFHRSASLRLLKFPLSVQKKDLQAATGLLPERKKHVSLKNRFQTSKFNLEEKTQ